MQDLERIKELLLKEKVDTIILKKFSINESMVKFVNNKIVKTGIESTSSVEVFVSKDKRIVMTSIKEFDEESIKKTISKLKNFLQYSQPNKNFVNIPENKYTYKEIKDIYDPKVENLDEVDVVESTINAALKNSSRVSGTFEKSYGKLSILTSTGIKQEDKSSSLYLSVRALKTKEASGHKTATSRVLSKFNPEQIGKEAGEIAKLSLNPKEGIAGKYDVIFSPLAFAPILENIGSATSIFNVESGMSFFQDKLGKKLGDFELIDDGNLENGAGSLKFDSEGYPTQKTNITQNGILKTYLHNNSSAQRYKTKSTGNAGIISPHPHNLVLDGEKGNVFDVKNGLYITNTWYTRFQNYTTGDFSTIPRDGMFLIKNGVISEPVKNLRVSDNILNLLKNIRLFGKEKEQITSWEADTPCIMAPILIKEVNITKPTN
ncbi:TldD/PmbA family protein [Candidatus Woesearchaeota archaeon]|nr:TldD/PmbA family protein [Candidatus Woesearchaeota archaeon]